MQKCDCMNVVFSVMPLYDYVSDLIKITKKWQGKVLKVIWQYKNTLSPASISAYTNR